MFGNKKYSMWLRATCGAGCASIGAIDNQAWAFWLGIAFLASACLLALSIVLNEPA